MASDDTTAQRFSLRRWSQRKLAAARAAEKPAVANAPASELPAPAGPAAPAAHAASPAPAAPQPAEAPPLPPVESLTLDSDFTPFLQPKVDEALKRQALKQLFRDPRFNVMDGLDVYIDDYTQPDPIPPDLVREMVQGRYIFDPPATRVNEQGVVEDVPPAAGDGARTGAVAGEASEAAAAQPEAGATDAPAGAASATASGDVSGGEAAGAHTHGEAANPDPSAADRPHPAVPARPEPTKR